MTAILSCEVKGCTTQDQDRIRRAIEGALLTDEELEGFVKGVEGMRPQALPNPFAGVPRCTLKI